MRIFSLPVAFLDRAQNATLHHIQVPVGSALLGVEVGVETVFLLIEETDADEKEFLNAAIILDGESVQPGRRVGSFSYPFDDERHRPRCSEDERRCLAHVWETLTEEGRPKRTPVTPLSVVAAAS